MSRVYSTKTDISQSLTESSTRKKRDPVATRARLLESARIVFTEKGYEAAGLREICSNAGVDQALVKRYFGSKEAMFQEMFDTGTGMNEILGGPRESLGAAIVDYYINKEKPDGKYFDATLALLRSVGSHQVNTPLRDLVESQYVDRLATLIGGRNAQQRAALIISQIIGFDVARRVLCIDSMSDRYKKTLRELWVQQIQTLVDGN